MLTQLRAFLVALEEGSLNRAAIRLRMSQSALSRQMQTLENEVGGALLERTTAGVALRKGEIDLALIGQEGALLSSEFYTHKLTTLPVVAVMPADHPLASRKRISLDELRGESFISSPEEDLPGRDRWITQLCRRAGFRPKFVQEAASVSQMFTLIGSEGAVTLVPAYLKSFPVADVAMVHLSDIKAAWDFLVVWQRGRTAKSLRALLDALAATANNLTQRRERRKEEEVIGERSDALGRTLRSKNFATFCSENRLGLFAIICYLIPSRLLPCVRF